MDVYFGCFFGNYMKQKKAGKAIPVNKEFVWDEEKWKILSLYDCKEGIVMDFYKELDPEEIRKFRIKWKDEISGYEDDFEFSEEMFEQLQEENPGECNVTPKMFVYGKELQSHGGCSTCYYPDSVFMENGKLDEEAYEYNPEAEELIKEYELNSDMAYIIFRWCFTWNKEWIVRKNNKYSLSDIQVKFEADYINKAGQTFHLNRKEESFSFINSINKKEYQITFKEPIQMKMDEEQFKKMKTREDRDYHYPTYYEIVPYKITPDLTEENYFIRPKVKGDNPVLIEDNRKEDMSIQMISGVADGPTSVFLCHRPAPGEKEVMSPLYFKPTEVRDYEIVFRVKQKKDIEINLEIV